MPTPHPMLHDPDARLDYKWPWAMASTESEGTDWLASGETITNHTIVVESGDVTVDENDSGVTDSDRSVVAWISGGTAGTTARVRCRITTSAARTEDRTIVLNVRNR